MPQSKLARTKATLRNLRAEIRGDRDHLVVTTGATLGLGTGAYLGPRMLHGMNIPFTPVPLNYAFGGASVLADLAGWTDGFIGATLSGLGKGMALGQAGVSGFQARSSP